VFLSWKYSYSVNGFITEWASRGKAGVHQTVPYWKLGEFRKPDQCIYSTDGGSANLASFTASPRARSMVVWVSYNHATYPANYMIGYDYHNKGANFLYTSGRVKFIPIKGTPSASSMSPTNTLEGKTQWMPDDRM
jgi:hypothetical protein